MAKYQFYRCEDGSYLTKTWDYEPTAREIGDEIRKLAKETTGKEPSYIRFWDADDGTYFDFGSWSVFGKITPSAFDIYLKGEKEWGAPDDTQD